MCGCEFNVAGAGGTIAGAVHGHFSSRSDISAIYHSEMTIVVVTAMRGILTRLKVQLLS